MGANTPPTMPKKAGTAVKMSPNSARSWPLKPIISPIAQMTQMTVNSVAMENEIPLGLRCIDCRIWPINSWSSLAACTISRSSTGAGIPGSNGWSLPTGATRGTRLRLSPEASAAVAIVAAIGGAVSGSRILSASWIAESATSVGSLLFFG